MDERTLCSRCISDYRDSGYRVNAIYPLQREECDKCNRIGIKVNIEEPTSRHVSSRICGGSFCLSGGSHGRGSKV